MAHPTATESEKESEGFLGQTKENPKSQRKWTKKKICLIMCLVCVLLVLLVVGGGLIYIFTRGSFGGNSDHWETILGTSSGDPNKVDINGVFELVSFDSNYEKYLKAMGIPFFVLPLILSSSEKISVEVVVGGGKEGEDLVKMRTINDLMTRESEFEFNKEFTMIYGKGSMEGIMYNLCTRKQHNLIHCSSEERNKGWKFDSELVFTEIGMINTRSFLTQDIVTKKYYAREGAKELIEKRMSKRDDTAVTHEMMNDWVDESWIENEDGWLEEDSDF
ncbi:uncharacterized protein LOC111712552 [Eurytemora carolleeae]|uniref:uncharacterized protein LOC111712552 n=1 Tax=Eurytemora carolleeae TaxID=1294199 RepID=UPI000C75D456|nr:uncharacterized protein LOC111712552 [Eurytemora carolleeae]XP_023342970.1 uncharacterized protein LOC111712552 [Eurytemora carolleeae]|eukprot:XP_023342969.1 uncharacterized protein LOC111712552 [Eurytemora affinis]